MSDHGIELRAEDSENVVIKGNVIRRPAGEDARRLLHEAYAVLRRVELYGDWDDEFWTDARDLKERLGEYLYPLPGET